MFKIIPPNVAFKDYNNPLMVIWNWSFFPLDMCISFTGFTSLYLYKNKNPNWRNCALISLVLVFCSGLQAISFWTIKLDFDITWWTANLYLMIYPLYFIPKILSNKLE